ncbi:mannitol 2-dehydrogenase [Lewinella aquimaris]|uniref:Mannitol 2-dehydrogenase n=1 Tax=Neolewinella aquimaris TaxID=1835722 RepID=A0A840E550_9BACT|nr:mannitol dehydrogenase family protein [Neolewinella aquimaris]MBB4080764.1 mannitol 2-dehydrogenase [Neolewinella aquimaris]
MEPIQLNHRNLGQIASRIPCPTYDRQELKLGIVHIGVGGFHRSHQAYYIHQLLERHGATEWGICGVGLREADRNIADVFAKQDCLYTLITQHPDGTEETEVIGSLKEFLLAVDDPDRVIDRMAHPATKIVSLTITEGGYNFNSVSEAFDFGNPDIQHELQHPTEPRTVFGYLTAALRKRRDAGLPPFTLLSCDNIQHNGDMARKMVLAFAQKQDPELAEWIEEKVRFPNTMVDRITPVTKSRDIEQLKNNHGVIDEWPVVCEPYLQWVVEDKFSGDRPPLEKVGVQFVPDVAPYERMKIRLLNAGHSVLGILSAIHGHPTIDACMGDPVFAAFTREFMDREVTPVLGTVEGVDIEQYKDSLEERFANPNIKDSVGRICSESSAKLPKFLIPTIRENLAADGSIEFATLVLAAWCYYSDKQVNENGEPLEIIDAMQAELKEAAQDTPANSLAFLQQPAIFGNLTNDKRFTQEYERMVRTIYRGGQIRQLMSDLL